MDIFLYYILPILAFMVLAFIFGFVLEYMGVRLTVNRDAKIDEVCKSLAGANCGGCGYAGCDAFAEALVAGKAKLSDCKPTGKEGKDEIAKILGVENDGEELVAVVHCNGGKNCKTLDYQGYGDCTSANIIAGGNKVCKSGCMHLGTCSDACQYYAINANNDKEYAEVKRNKCIACGACVEECPKHLISLIPKRAKIFVACSNKEKGVLQYCKVGCIACGACVRACPEKAFTVVDNLATVDYSKCTGCLACVAKCPTKVIKVIEG